MGDVFEQWFEAGWNSTGEGHNAEYWRPRRPYAEAWADEIAEGRAACWPSLLASSLAIAAGLCRAFELGRNLQHVLTNADWLETKWECDRERAAAMRDYFHPGCGRSAP